MQQTFQRVDQARNAELAVVGSILLDERCLTDVRREVESDSFASEDCRAAFSAACALADKGRPIDPVTVQGMAPELTRDFLVQCMDITPTARNAGAHAKIVAQEALRRRYIEVLSCGVDELCAGQDPAHVLGDIQQETGKMLESRTRGDVVPLSTVLADFVDKLQSTDSGYSPFLPTGYRKLDSILGGGMIREGLYVLAARPGCGKTTLALNITLQMLRHGKRILFVSLEMSREQIGTRLISLAGRKHTFADITSGRAVREDPDGWDWLVDTSTDLSKCALDVFDKAGVTPDRILLDAQAKQYDLVVIDYLGLLDQRKGSNRYDRTTFTSNELKRMSRKLGIPVLCLAQLNRESEGRVDGKPRVSDLRDSGSIEQDADAVLLIHSSAQEAKGEGESTPTEVIVGKNRHGRTGVVEMDWFKRDGLFVEVGF